MPAPQRRGRLVPPEDFERQQEDEAQARIARFVERATGERQPRASGYDDEITDDAQVSAAMARYTLRRHG